MSHSRSPDSVERLRKTRLRYKQLRRERMASDPDFRAAELAKKRALGAAWRASPRGKESRRLYLAKTRPPVGRTIRTARIVGAIAFVPLTQGHEAKIDTADLHLVQGFNWYAVRQGKAFYAARKGYAPDGRKTMIMMHRVILGENEKPCVDHIDGNTLDNRRSNLRGATHAENAWNSRSLPGKSGYRGVRWSKGNKGWVAIARAGGKAHHIGTFKAAEDAARAYDAAVTKLHGEFAQLNFPAGRQALRGGKDA